MTLFGPCELAITSHGHHRLFFPVSLLDRGADREYGTRMDQSSGDPNGSGDRACVGPVPTILAPLKPLEDVLALMPSGREGP
jgi:hypothetical protein